MARKPNPDLVDDDAQALSDEQLAEFRPATEVLPAEFLAAYAKRRRGRPRLEAKKVEVKLRSIPTSWSDFVRPVPAGKPG